MGSQSATSKPLTATQRRAAYNAGVDAIGGTDVSQFGGGYEAPDYERLGEGDYEALRSGLTAGTERQQELALRDSDQDASDRGIYTSLNALRLNNDVRERYAPEFRAADATVAQMKAEDIAGANAAGMENANRRYESGWRPFDYLSGIYNNTGGSVSSSGGWSI